MSTPTVSRRLSLVDHDHLARAVDRLQGRLDRGEYPAPKGAARITAMLASAAPLDRLTGPAGEDLVVVTTSGLEDLAGYLHANASFLRSQRPGRADEVAELDEMGRRLLEHRSLRLVLDVTS